jgi:hypothetical protein
MINGNQRRLRMNRQEIEKAIYVMKNIKHLLVDVIGNKNNEKELDMAISALEHQLNGGWIPVSERLPEENGHYLVTYHEWSKGKYLPEFDLTYAKTLRFYRGEFKMPVCCNDKIEQDIGREVLAWRELPEPYKEG